MKEKHFTSPLKQKVLLLLATGVVLSLTRSPKQYYKMVKAAAREWKFINRRYLWRLVREFKNERLVDFREKDNGEIMITLNKRGKTLILNFDFDKLEIPEPAFWDKKWRLVIFDVPERKRRARNALRQKLVELGFRELQRSVFIHPYDCQREIDFVVEFFEVRPCVRLVTAEKITNEAELLLKFGLHKKI
ncbi:MAG: CRISPR-associated endonuclease Cas2 [Candidatus Vogelbacteria bacterium]|nr:CRISPR-associated endonuclease Cas2 [Candidatus Vogelbacteria bacterium]